MANRSPIDPLLATVESILNRGLRRSTSATEAAEALEGRAIVVEAGSTTLAATIRVEDGALRVTSDVADDADAIMSGGLLGLARVVGGDTQTALSEGAATIRGDAEIAEKFQALLSMSRPDLEEELSAVTGDAVANQVGNAVRGLASWARDATGSVARSLGEYLSEERRDVPTKAELDRFGNDVDVLTEDVDRAADRLRRLRQDLE